MVDREKAGNERSNQTAGASESMAALGDVMKLLLSSVLMLLMVPRVAVAKELPDAPSTTALNEVLFVQPTQPAQLSVPVPNPTVAEKKTVDKSFVGLALISTGATFADSYTTLFARENWLAGKKGVCNMEVQSAYLYGTHPTVAHAYAVASVKSVSSAFAAYYLRKHHSKFWSAPLVVNSIISLQGVGQNMAACN